MDATDQLSQVVIMKKMSDFSKYTNKTKGAMMKFFNKNDQSDMPFGASEIIKDETAAIISELGNTNSADDISFEPVAKNRPQTPPQQPQRSVPQHSQHSPPQQPQQQSQQVSASQNSSSTNATTAESAKQNTTSARMQTPSSIKFGIKDAIDLINSLPTDNSDIVIPVVIKTLESANIHLDDIIEDAEKHEKILETRSHRLIEQIEELESHVANLSDEVMNLNTHLEEISHVRTLLSFSFDDDLEEDDMEAEALAVEFSAEDTKTSPGNKPSSNRGSTVKNISNKRDK